LYGTLDTTAESMVYAYPRTPSIRVRIYMRSMR